jgi:hypothetical protein
MLSHKLKNLERQHTGMRSLLGRIDGLCGLPIVYFLITRLGLKLPWQRLQKIRRDVLPLEAWLKTM